MTVGIREAIFKHECTRKELAEIEKAYPVGCIFVCSPTKGKPEIMAKMEGYGEWYSEPTRVMARNVETMKTLRFDVDALDDGENEEECERVNTK